MKLKELQFIDYMLKQYSSEPTSQLVVKSGDIVFAADYFYFNLQQGTVKIDYHDSEMNHSLLNLGSSDNESFSTLVTKFMKKHVSSFTNKLPSWSMTMFLKQLEIFLSTNSSQLDEIETSPTNITMIQPVTELKVILFEPDADFTIIGVK